MTAGMSYLLSPSSWGRPMGGPAAAPACLSREFSPTLFSDKPSDRGWTTCARLQLGSSQTVWGGLH